MIARPSAASSRIVPSEMPLKTRAAMSPFASRPSTADSERSRFGADLVVGFDELAVLLLEDREQQRLGRAGVALRQRADRGKPRRAVGARELDRRLRQRQQALDLRVGFLARARRRSPAARPRRRCSAAPSPPRAARRDRATTSLNAAIAVASDAPQPIVDDDVFAIVGQRRDRLAGDGIDAPCRP